MLHALLFTKTDTITLGLGGTSGVRTITSNRCKQTTIAPR